MEKVVMTRLFVRMVLAVAIVGAAASASLARQTTTASTETKTFEILAVTGNTLLVRLPEGTRELTVADDFRFNVNGKPLAARELKAGMKGSATITTRTTVTPVTVTEVKDGTVALSTGGTIIVRTDEGIKSFTQGDIDKRGVKIIRNGVPASVSDFREGDRLSATIVTSKAPLVVTEQEVQATLAKANPAGAAARPASGSGAASASASASASSSGAGSASASASGGTARRLPKTASSWPLLGAASALSLAIGFALTIRRRYV
jgi:hypothetical protein